MATHRSDESTGGKGKSRRPSQRQRSPGQGKEHSKSGKPEECHPATPATSLATVFQDIDDGLIVLDSDWRCTYVNKAAAAFLKATPEEIAGKILWETFPNLQNSRFHKEFLRAATERVFVKIEDYYEPLGRWYECRCHCTTDGLAVLLNDTTRHKKVEQVMLESRQALEMAITGSNAGIWRVDLNPEKPGRTPDHLYLSPQLKALIGFESDEFPSSRSAWLDRIVPEDRSCLDEAARTHADGRTEMYQVDYRIRHKDGSVRWLSRRGKLYRDEFNRPVRWAGVDTDITDRKLAGEALRENEERLRQALEAGQVFTFEWRPATDQVLRSPNCASILGWTGDATHDTGKDFFRGIHLEDREAFMRLVSTLSPERPAYEATYRYIRRDDGREVVLEESGRAVFDDSGTMVCLGGLTRDVTERKRMEQSLQQANELLQARAEELQSANEELQTQQEDLQSQAEELQNANEELRVQQEELQAQAEDLRQSERALRQAHAQAAWQARFPQENPNPVLRVSAEGSVLYCNPAAARLPGWACEVGQPLPQAVLRRLVGEAMAHGRTVEQDVELGEAYYAASVIPVQAEHYANLYGRDITERKQAEQARHQLNEELEQRVEERTADLSRANVALRQAGAYNRSLIEASLDPLVTIGPDGRITDVNKATEEVTGCLRTELVGSDFSQYFTEPEKADEGYRKVFREGSVQDYPLEIRHKDGRVSSVLYNATIYRDGAGEVIGVFAAARDVTELRRAEHAVQAERQRFNDVLEMLPAYLVLLTPDYQVPFANRFFRERFGESHGKRCFEYLFNRAEPCEVCDSYKVLETHAPHRWEWTGPDGRIYDVYDFPFTDSDGSTLIMEMGIDISDRKRAEAALKEVNETLERRVAERTTALQEANEELNRQAGALRESEERFRRAVENASGAIVIAGLDGTIYYANRGFLALLGYSEQNRLEKPLRWDAITPPEYADVDARAIAELRDSGVASPREKEYIARNGRRVPVLVSGSVMGNGPDGKPQVVAFITDLTQRRQMEEQLRRLNDQLEEEVQAQTEELRDMVDRLQDEVVRRVLAEGKLRKSSQMLEGFFQHTITPLAFMDRRFNFVRVNEAYAASNNQTPDFFKGKNHFVLYPNDENQTIFETVVRSGQPYRAHARPFTQPGKPQQVTYWDWQLTPLRNDRGEVQYLVLNLRNVTEQQATLRELEHRAFQLQKLTLELSQAEDRERRRMAEVLHDGLQQQLAAAKFHLGLLSSRTKTDAGMQELAGQLDRMLHDAIEQSRSLSHELSPAVLYQSDLGETFEWLARQVRSKHGLTVHTEIHGRVDSQSESIKAFLFRTGQEILFNAVKHAEVTEARLRLQRRNGELWLTIADQGRGFDPNTLGRAAGFGLLSIRERVSLLGGRMKIRSVPNHGSVFLIVVPDAQIAEDRGQRTEDGEQKTEGTTQHRPPSSALRPPVLRVLLVDDHKVMREGLAALIAEQQDMEIVGQAGDGREAVEQTRLLRPDVVIMDVAMPVMAGDEATRRIKTELPRTRVIALSMFEEPGVREKMLDAGAETYLPKTGPSEGFLAAIRGSDL